MEIPASGWSAAAREVVREACALSAGDRRGHRARRAHRARRRRHFAAVNKRYTPQLTMQGIIDEFDAPAPGARRARARRPTRCRSIRCGCAPPLPRPGKILACIANYWEHAQREPRPLNMFMKNPDAVVGPGDTIMLPEFTVPWMFMHEAELALVIKGPGQEWSRRKDWRSAVFGYTGDDRRLGARRGRRTWQRARDSWLGKSFDTFAPIGPCITTADEIADPNDLIVRFWNDGQLRHNYNTDDMEHRVPELDRIRHHGHDDEFRRPDRLRHQPRGTRRLAGRRDGRNRDPADRPHVADGRPIRSSATGSAASTWASIRPIPMRSSGIDPQGSPEQP